jgi:hypothetical protein
MPSFEAPGVATPTVLTFELTVTDDQTATDTDTVDVTVNPTGGGTGAFVQSGGQVTMEAESHHNSIIRAGHEWQTHSTAPNAPAGFAGTGALRALPSNSTAWKTGFVGVAPEVSYEILFASTGPHILWVRGYGFSGGDDSLHVGFDGAANAGTTNIGVPQGGWGWVNAGTINVPSVGVHTVNVWPREDGVGLDKLILTTNGGFVPVGTGPAESPTDD